MLDYDKNTRNEILRNAIPYVIMWNEDKDYFVLNRNNCFIFMKDQEENINEYLKKGYPLNIKGKEYLYDDDSPAYKNKKLFNKMCKNYTKTIVENKLEKCMNGKTLQSNFVYLFD